MTVKKDPLADPSASAREEFLKAYHAKAKEFDEERDSELLFCKNIAIGNPDKAVGYCPSGVVLVRSTSDPSLWDAWIHKVSNVGHQAATTEFGRQLGNYAKAMSSKFIPKIQAAGGHTKVAEFELDDEVFPESRIDPDQALRVMLGDDTEPRVVIEVELSNRDPLPLAKHVQRLLVGWPLVRCIIGLKIYKRSHVGGEFACVCFVWKKRADDSIYIERVFDAGPRKNSMRSCEPVADFWTNVGVDFSAVSKDDGKTFQVAQLPSDLDYPLPEDCPDELEDYFTISVDKSNVYHGHTPSKRQQRGEKPKFIGELEDGARLEIDLFSVLKEIDESKTENFN